MPRQPMPSVVLIMFLAAFGIVPPGGSMPLGAAAEAPDALVGVHSPARGSMRVADDGAAPDVTIDQMTVAVPSSAAPAPTSTAPPAEATPGTTPVEPSDGAVAALPDGTGHVQTAPIDTSAVQTVGVTWPDGRDGESLRPQMRTKEGNTWSAWQDLPVSDNAPDSGTADAAHMRGGTDSVWIGDADAVQFGFTASQVAPVADVKVALVGSEPVATATSPAVWSGAPTVRGVAATTEAVGTALTAPTVITRDQWGAAPAVCTPDVATTLVGAVVHHTADSNDYTTQAQAEQMIRNDQAYHINSRGWCDLGYNFVVDKWGNLYEGRANSLTQPVIGVHAGGFNTGTVGVAMLGTYDAVPSNETLMSVGRIIGWRLGAYGIDPLTSMQYSTGVGENSRYLNETVTLPRVFGHRDVAYTACPGNGGYAALGTIRAIAAQYSSQVRHDEALPIVQKLYRDLLGREADPAGLAANTASIVNGASPADIAQALATSPEYAFATVARDYQDVLHRAPDPEGLATWTNAIIGGLMRSEDLRIWLFGSQEYYNVAGETNETYAAALYRDVLGRTAGPEEMAFWAPLVAAHGRDAVVRGFWKSMESANVRVEAAYQHFLGRSADPSGMATWPPVLLARGEGELRSQLVNSLEYRNIAHAAAAAAAPAGA